MDTCAEFVIHDPRLGDPTLKHDIPQIIEVSIAMLQPIRDALVERGFEAGEVTAGKPWCSVFTVREGKLVVSLIFSPDPSKEKNRWEGALYLHSLPPFWRGILGMKDRPTDTKLVQRVAEALKPLLADCPHLTGVRWISLQRLCSSGGYEDDETRI